jgi:predicted transcriptional regulator
MGNRSALDLMRPTERAILTILWRNGPSTVSHLQTQLGGARYTTVASPLQSLQKKGFVT